MENNMEHGAIFPPQYTDTFLISNKSGPGGDCVLEFYYNFPKADIEFNADGKIVSINKVFSPHHVASVVMSKTTVQELYNTLGKVIADDQRNEAEQKFRDKFMGNGQPENNP